MTMEHGYPGRQPEEDKTRELFDSLGEDFKVCWDALNISPDKEQKFFEILKRLENKKQAEKPVYLDYIKRLFKEEFEEFKPDIKQSNLDSTKHLAGLAASFIERVEFFDKIISVPDRITNGGRSVGELEVALREADVLTDGESEIDMIRSEDFKSSILKNSEQERISLVRVMPFYLFNDREYRSLEEVNKKAKEFGLELCPPEVGPIYRLAYRREGELKKDQQNDEGLTIAMKPIVSSNGFLKTFYLGFSDNGPFICDDNVDNINPVATLVFRLRPEKPTSKSEATESVV
ncbi:MAG: hypothetical protein G01um101413_596 [Parcubacteria group bacterium Gr01-1014_13]|nr:MAG: hypothetical protein G01um101413_596 [Parcubacteria group bacterium Gr01-1014_13]